MALYRNTKTGEVRQCPNDYVFSTAEAWERFYDAEVKQSYLSTQIGGSHYKDMAIQPVEFIHKNRIGFIEGCCIKYLCRWRSKNGVEDLKKAKHFIDMLIEMEEKKC